VAESVTKWARGLTASDRGKIVEFNGVRGLLRNVEYYPAEGTTHVDLVVGFDLADDTVGQVWG